MLSTYRWLGGPVLLVLALFGGPAPVQARSTGAPVESCQTLVPKHGASRPQPANANPFRFNATVYPYMNEEEFVHIELYSTSAKATFRGFVVQARLAENPDLLLDGNFVPADNGDLTRAYLCGADRDMEANNTWTHVDRSPKQKVAAFWFPTESAATQQIVFMATVAYDKSTFWTGLKSNPIQMGELINNLNGDGGDGGGQEDTTGSTTEADGDTEDETDQVDDSTETTNAGVSEAGEAEVGEEEEDQPQPEPSNNVDRIVSSALTINDFGWSSLLALMVSMFIFRNFL